jgi:hypothetical protein
LNDACLFARAFAACIRSSDAIVDRVKCASVSEQKQQAAAGGSEQRDVIGPLQQLPRPRQRSAAGRNLVLVYRQVSVSGDGCCVTSIKPSERGLGGQGHVIRPRQGHVIRPRQPLWSARILGSDKDASLN